MKTEILIMSVKFNRMIPLIVTTKSLDPMRFIQ